MTRRLIAFMPLVLAACSETPSNSTRENTTAVANAAPRHNKYEAITACNSALVLELDSHDDDHRMIADSMFGEDAGSETVQQADGSYAVTVSHAGPSTGSCPTHFVGECTVKDGQAQVTSPLGDHGYLPC